MGYFANQAIFQSINQKFLGFFKEIINKNDKKKMQVSDFVEYKELLMFISCISCPNSWNNSSLTNQLEELLSLVIKSKLEGFLVT